MNGGVEHSRWGPSQLIGVDEGWNPGSADSSKARTGPRNRARATSPI